jgi:hypothetical protein
MFNCHHAITRRGIKIAITCRMLTSKFSSVLTDCGDYRLLSSSARVIISQIFTSNSAQCSLIDYFSLPRRLSVVSPRRIIVTVASGRVCWDCFSLSLAAFVILLPEFRLKVVPQDCNHDWGMRRQKAAAGMQLLRSLCATSGTRLLRLNTNEDEKTSPIKGWNMERLVLVLLFPSFFFFWSVFVTCIRAVVTFQLLD